MKFVMAYKNHGRWLVDCPKHGIAGAMPVDFPEYKNGYIPPCCYPKIIANMGGIAKLVGRVMNPDRAARDTAKLIALQNDEVYTITYPDEREEIEGLLSVRNTENQNWKPGEDVKYLRKENKLVGLPTGK